MDVPTWVWIATIVGLLAVMAVDLAIVDVNPHVVTVRESTRWVIFYIACAVAFGAGVWAFAGGDYAGQFFAGYITEYSLSVDNLFIFVVVLTAFEVPRIHQHRVLLIGILIALVLRGAFIAVGAAAIARFSWVFYVFGVFLIYTAYRQARTVRDEEPEYSKENIVLRTVRRVLPVTDEFHGAKVVARVNGKRMVTPMLVVMIAIGTADLLFAVDSIPAIFGLTKEPYLVFTANAFALMGLRQLYFLLGGLLRKLIYLPIGLAVVLAFIGVKLILEALHSNMLPFINGGESVPVPEIPIVVSLAVIVVVLVITTVASLYRTRRDTQTNGAN
jgi:tellurite resistance protein TerC